MTDSKDSIHLSRDVALVLFEMCSRAAPSGAFRPADSADQRALWELKGELERRLVEPFQQNYLELLEGARDRLRDVEPMESSAGKRVVFVDVDDTLVRSVGSKRIPMTGVIQRVRDLHGGGAHLYCWSSGGAEYAHRSAVELGTAECFVDFLAKPQVLIDDQPPSEWRSLVFLHPSEISAMSVSEIEGLLSRPRHTKG